MEFKLSSPIFKGIVSDSNNIFLWHESEDEHFHVKVDMGVKISNTSESSKFGLK